MNTPHLSTAHRRRLRALWRSAGWPYQDPLEAELLALGLLARQRDDAGRETVRVTDAGVAVLAQTLQRNRAARSAHEALVARVAQTLQREGRIAWRARVGDMGDSGVEDMATDKVAHEPSGRWVMAMPDVYSIRHTTVEAYLAPVAHEIKVRRADLLSDLRRPAKGEAYRQLASECWYVLREGIAQADEVPEVYGVMMATDDGTLTVARPAPRRAMRLPFASWMALARATPEPMDDHEAQAWLGEPGEAR
jgi:hypothetical protein